jgi:hypothetical protein
MWGRCKDAIKTDLILPMTPEIVREVRISGLMDAVDARGYDTAQQLFAELTQREFGYTLSGNKIHLETKKDMKDRGLASPDIADALALNFAQDVSKMAMPAGEQCRLTMSDHEYDPFSALH